MQRRKRMAMPALLRREKGAHLVSPGRRSRVERGGRARLEQGIFKPQPFAGVAETGIAALRCYRLQTTGRAKPPCILAPEDLARPVQPAGFFFATKPDTGRTDGGRRGSRRGYRATSLWGHPNENPGTKRSTTELVN